MSINQLWKSFVQPDDQYRIMPLFRVNDEVRPAQIEWQVASLRKQGCGGLFACFECYRGGAPYKFLSNEWWRAIRVLAKACAKTGLQFWAYDEQDWPSGAAGGQVVKQKPETLWKYITRQEQTVTGPQHFTVGVSPARLLAVVAFQLHDEKLVTDSVHDLTRECRNGELSWDVPDGQWTVASYAWKFGKGGFQGVAYPDLLDARTSAEFIKLSYAAHVNHVRQANGAPLTGFFTDEPSGVMAIDPRGGWALSLPWTPQLPAAFRKRHGYDLLSHLPFLYHEDHRRAVSVRCHFWETCTHLFSKNYVGALSRFCEKHGILFSGHFLGEEAFCYHLAGEAGNQLRQYRSLHVPGIDWIHPCDQCQHLPATTPKYATSVAHFLGRERTWCESFAASGWGCTFKEFQRMVNWEHVNGINMQIPISYKYSLRGTNRATFYNPGISYQQPYWDHFRAFADYEARLCALTAGGGHQAQLALYSPVSDIAAHCWDQQVLEERSNEFNRLGDQLRLAGYDFDLMDDEFLAEARSSHGRLCLGREKFAVVVLPRVDTMPRSTLAKLHRFVQQGGWLLALGQPPRHSPEGGAADPDLAALVGRLFGLGAVTRSAWRRVQQGVAGRAPSVDELLALLVGRLPPDVQVEDGSAPVVGYHRRIGRAHLYLLYNPQDSQREVGITLGAKGHPEIWHPMSGSREGLADYAFSRKGTRLTLAFRPYELIPVLLRHHRSTAAPHRHRRILQEHAITGPFGFAIEETLKRPESAWNVAEYGDWTSRARPVSPPEKIPLGDWCAHGLQYFSGLGHYSTDFKLTDVPEGARVILDLGQVAVSAEVKINHQSAGVVCLEPYVLDITGFVRAGKNHLEVIVANTLSNHFAQFTQLESKPLHEGGDRQERRRSGLLGPVSLKVVRDSV